MHDLLVNLRGFLPYSDSTLLMYLTNTVLFFLVVIAVRLILDRSVERREGLSVETRRRWRVNLRNVMVFVFVAGLLFIWAKELRTFAVSMVAIAVAIVLATRELILCVSGAVLRGGTNAYSVGDRIEIEGLRGDVIDQNLMTTTLLEIGPGKESHQYTGRAVVFPNSLLLNSPLVNETFMGDYVVHVMTVPLDAKEDWRRAEQRLLNAAQEECGPFLEEAQRHMTKLQEKEWIDTPSVLPRVSLEVPEPGRINLLLRIPTPGRRKGRLEQAILRRFLTQCDPMPGEAERDPQADSRLSSASNAPPLTEGLPTTSTSSETLR